MRNRGLQKVDALNEVLKTAGGDYKNILLRELDLEFNDAFGATGSPVTIAEDVKLQIISNIDGGYDSLDTAVY